MILESQTERREDGSIASVKVILNGQPLWVIAPVPGAESQVTAQTFIDSFKALTAMMEMAYRAGEIHEGFEVRDSETSSSDLWD